MYLDKLMRLFVLVALVLTCGSGSSQAAPPAFSGLTINGAIANLEQLKPFLTENTNLQLSPCPPDDRPLFRFVQGKGVLAVSEGPELAFPSDGKFAFKIPKQDIKEGTYLIAIQQAKSPVVMERCFLCTADKDGKVSALKVKIGSDLNYPYVIDLGKVIALAY
jgi:hypothetical protein